ncbi:MAG: amino acid permease, partial [Cytophagales bacterium]|nr:amino acid permease [Cytophagales bacterium]
MANPLFTTKPLAKLQEEAADTEGLKRQLGGVNLVMLGIGAIIGAGLFSLTGLAAANNAGPAVTIAFVVAAVGCAFAGLCYAEFASMIPIAGSAYTYSYATMGEFMAWIIGWDLVLEYAVGAATVSISWSQYLTKFLSYYDVHLPVELTHSPWETVTMADGSVVSGMINLPAVFIVVVLSLLLIKGTRESALFNGIIVMLKVSVVIVFIFLGYNYVNPANYTPYIPENTGVFGEFGWSGIFRAAAVVFFAFIGFDAVSTAAGEARKPQRTVPVALVSTVVVATLLYVAVGVVLTGLVPYQELNVSDPISKALREAGPLSWLDDLVNVAAVVGLFATVLVTLYGQVRILMRMANDGMLPPVFSRIDPHRRTPVATTVACGAACAV